MGISFTKKFTSFLLLLALVTSCGKKPEDEVESKLISAEILLSTSECQEAIDFLEGMGRQNKNARYLKLLASSYACRAGYSTIKFFADDIALTGAPAPMGGLSRYSTSQVTFTSPLEDDLKFKDLQTAIDILLYAGGIATTTEPTSVVRATNFSASDASDINAQMAYMMLVQLGRIFKVYANTNLAGVKGTGLASNVCFSDYSTIDPVADAALHLVITNQAGACKVKNSPHPQLDSALVTPARRRARLCQGIVTLNGILDVLPAIIVAAGGGKLGDISAVTGQISAGKTALITAYPAIGPVLTVLSQSNCETSPSINIDAIEAYYAAIFEGLMQ